MLVLIDHHECISKWFFIETKAIAERDTAVVVIDAEKGSTRCRDNTIPCVPSI